MKILILTQYFPPEVGAPQNRLFELALRLKNAGEEITILTAMPNYPWMEIHQDYKGKKRMQEQLEGLDVYRARIYITKSKGVYRRLLNYFSFVWTSLCYGIKIPGKFDYIFCESPPLFLGISAWILCKIKRARLIFNVSDLWPESAEKLGLVTNRVFLKTATILEEFLYKKSYLISGQTQGIVKNISSRFPEKDVYWLPNGVDLSLFEDVQDTDFRARSGIANDAFLLVYAGIIGHAQGLDIIIRVAKRLSENNKIHFLILGSGPLKDSLMNAAESESLSNITFLDAVQKIEMPAILSSCDASIIPLKKLDLFKGAIPSKIFEVLAMKKPILLGVDGEARTLFIENGKAGIYFTPEDDEELCRGIMRLADDRSLCREFGRQGFTFVKQNFTRDMIAAKFLEHLKSRHASKP